MKIVTPMLGASEDFGKWGKFLQASNGVSLIECVLNNLKTWAEGDFVFVISDRDKKRHLDSVLKLFCPGCEIVVSKGKTNGALCSVLLASEYFGNDEILIANADQIVEFDGKIWLKHLRDNGFDVGTVIFDSVHPRWSSVRLDEDGHVIEASEKRPISTHATAGLYWFASTIEFSQFASRLIVNGDDVDGSFFVCPVLNEYVLEGYAIHAFEIEKSQYVSLSTQDDFEAYRQRQMKDHFR
jgi:dTDP-glucose pyrophosphorylase